MQIEIGRDRAIVEELLLTVFKRAVGIVNLAYPARLLRAPLGLSGAA
jgi:hypothetical protein